MTVQLFDVVATRLQPPGRLGRRAGAEWVHRAARGCLDDQADPQPAGVTSDLF